MLHRPPMPAPKFATPRDLSRPTLGGRQRNFSRLALGKDFMPVQRYIADVAGELLPNGLPAYNLIVGTLPRRGGKTHLELVQTCERCHAVPNYRAWYTAQTGKDARDNFLEFNTELVVGTPLDQLVKLNRGNGHELMRFLNGSEFRPHPPVESALHGKKSHRNSVDEAWWFSDDEGDALLQAIAPTQLTIPGAQTYIWSAGGTAASTWLAKLVDLGRRGVTALQLGEEPVNIRMAFFEWGIPDDADPEDIDVVANHHPAYGWTVTRDSFVALRDTFGDDVAGWARAAGNRWTEVIGGGIDEQTWESVRYPDPIPAGVPVGFGASRSPAGDQVVIAVAAQVEPDLIVVEVLEVLPTSWQAAGHVNAWATGGPLAVYPNGSSAGLHRALVDLEREDLVAMNQRDLVAATTTILDALPHRGVRFRRHPALDAAVPAAALRTVLDGGKVWTPATEAPIAALEAATAAIAALRPSNQPPAPMPAPYVVFA